MQSVIIMIVTCVCENICMVRYLLPIVMRARRMVPLSRQNTVSSSVGRAKYSKLNILLVGVVFKPPDVYAAFYFFEADIHL